MRLLSWTALYLFFFVLCAMCMMGTLGGVDRPSTLKALERRKEDTKSASSATTDKPLPAKTADETEDETSKKSATSTVKSSDSRKTTEEPKKTSTEPKTSAPPKTSAAARPTSAATTEKESAKPTSPTPLPTESTKKAASSSDSSMTSPSASTPASLASSTSSLTSTDVPQPTPILAQQPQAANRVSVGGIVAGIIFAATVLIGMAWIAVGKWREKRRHRAHFGDDEAKHGLSAAGADDHYSSSHDSLLAGGKLVGDSDGLRLQSLSSPRVGAQSFVSSYHSPTSQVPQDVLPTISPIEAKSLPGLPTSEDQFSTALGSHPIIAEMPSPHVSMLPAGQQAGGSAARKPVPQINVTSPGA